MGSNHQTLNLIRHCLILQRKHLCDKDFVGVSFTQPRFIQRVTVQRGTADLSLQTKYRGASPTG